MAVIGFNFSKMLAEKKSAPKGELKVQINLAIKDVEEANFGLGKTKEQGLKYSFEFTTKYVPNFGSIVLTGEVLDLQDEKTVKAVLKEWKDTKKLDDKLVSGVYNSALQRCSVQALILSKEMGLPSPIPLLRKA
ncbi:hypothetical protein J4439_03485 [Candidatus Woesearchaeota archaeon]|nr:hypothetical protein [Candidatus Woesearchaeota archaeon]